MAGVFKVTANGTKDVNINRFPDEAWTIVSGGATGDEGELEKLWRRVPWLNRGVGILSNALTSVPFVILNAAGDEVDGSEDYQNATGLWDNPFNDLWLMEASLNIFGATYWLKEKRGPSPRVSVPAGLRYFVPHTITPKISPDDGLTGFKRQVRGRSDVFEIDELLYIWLNDPYSEIGPPKWSRAIAAMTAAEVLANVDEFAATFFKTGAIKTTLLRVSGNPPQAEKERIKSLWQRIFSRGLKGMGDSMVMNADALEPVTIGEGISELGNSELTKEKREDISTALGVPQSMLFSNAANFSVKEGDKRDLYEETVIPDARMIEAAVNAQYLAPAGYRLQFRPDEMSIFQEDEEDRSGVILNLVNSMVSSPPKVARLAFEIAGVDLPGGMEYDEFETLLAAVKAEAPEPQPTAASPNLRPVGGTLPEGDDEGKSIVAELDAWERWTLRRVEKGKHRTRQFVTKEIPAKLANLIADLLDEAEDADRVREIFATAKGD